MNDKKMSSKKLTSKQTRVVMISIIAVLAVLICSVIIVAVVLKNHDADKSKRKRWDGVTVVAPTGSGESVSDPYIIATPENLAYIAKNTQFNGQYKYYKLTNDLNMGGHDWLPIGSSINAFTGEFNGNNHIISNIGEDEKGYYSDSSKVAPSLFGVARTATILNLRVEYAFEEVSGTFAFGGIVNEAKGGVDIRGCGNITSKITFADTSSLSSVTGIGGLIGYTMGRFYIENSYSLTSLTVHAYRQDAGSKAYVGGLVGAVNDYSANGAEKIFPEIRDCYYAGKISTTGNAAAVYAENIIGKDVGENPSMSICDVTNVYTVYDINGETELNPVSSWKENLSNNWTINPKVNKGFPLPSKNWGLINNSEG